MRSGDCEEGPGGDMQASPIRKKTISAQRKRELVRKAEKYSDMLIQESVHSHEVQFILGMIETFTTEDRRY